MSGQQSEGWRTPPVHEQPLSIPPPLPPLSIPRYTHLFLYEIRNAGKKCVINRGDQNNVYGLEQH